MIPLCVYECSATVSTTKIMWDLQHLVKSYFKWHISGIDWKLDIHEQRFTEALRIQYHLLWSYSTRAQTDHFTDHFCSWNTTLLQSLQSLFCMVWQVIQCWWDHICSHMPFVCYIITKLKSVSARMNIAMKLLIQSYGSLHSEFCLQRISCSALLKP